MAQLPSQKYLYGELTWPEVNTAVSQEKVILMPVGSTEQHGPHLPLDVDNLIVSSLCLEAGRRSPDKAWWHPPFPMAKLDRCILRFSSIDPFHEQRDTRCSIILRSRV